MSYKQNFPSGGLKLLLPSNKINKKNSDKKYSNIKLSGGRRGKINFNK